MYFIVTDNEIWFTDDGAEYKYRNSLFWYVLSAWLKHEKGIRREYHKRKLYNSHDWYSLFLYFCDEWELIFRKVILDDQIKRDTGLDGGNCHYVALG